MSLPHASAQTEAFCSITDYTVETISNAVVVTLKADGLLSPGADRMDFFQERPNKAGWERRRLTRFPFYIFNARSKIGSLVDVSQYPLSHIELAIPPDAPEGVGIKATAVLYKPGISGKIELGDASFGRVFQRGDCQVNAVLSESRREIIITVITDRFQAERAAVTPRADRTLTERLDVRKATGGYLVDALNVPLGRLMEAISNEAGIAVVVDDQVHRRATVHLDGVPFEALINSIARGYGLSLAHSDDVYYLSDGVPSSVAPYWAARSANITVNYLSPDDALNALPNFLVRYVRKNVEGNSLTVTGPEQLIDKLRRDIARIDVPGGHVRMRALLIESEATSETRKALGAALGRGDTRGAFDTDGGLVEFATTDYSLREVLASLRGLQTRGKADLHVQPATTVLSGGSANVFLGQRRYYQFTPRDEVQLKYVDIGVNLDCSPFVGGKGIITSYLSLEALNVIAVDALGLPTLSARRASSTLRCETGNCIIVGGGMNVVEQSRTRGQVTPLQAVPLLNWLARGAEDEGRRMDVTMVVEFKEVDGSAAAGVDARAKPAPAG